MLAGQKGQRQSAHAARRAWDPAPHSGQRERAEGKGKAEKRHSAVKNLSVVYEPLQ